MGCIARLHWFDGEIYQEMALASLPATLVVPVWPCPTSLAQQFNANATEVEFRLERTVLSEDDPLLRQVGEYRSYLTIAEMQSALFV